MKKIYVNEIFYGHLLEKLKTHDYDKRDGDIKIQGGKLIFISPIHGPVELIKTEPLPKIRPSYAITPKDAKVPVEPNTLLLCRCSPWNPYPFLKTKKQK